MIVKFNPTGAHIQKGFLKVRLDLYPDIGDKTYPIHYVQVPVIPPEGYQGDIDWGGMFIDQNDYNNWISSLPKVWQLNPCLCHFIKVDANITRQGLTDYILDIFSGDTLLELDDALFNNRRDRVQQLMRHKIGSGKKLRLPISQKAEEKLVGQLNYRFADMEIEV